MKTPLPAHLAYHALSIFPSKIRVFMGLIQGGEAIQ